jgi:hypothetical protein
MALQLDIVTPEKKILSDIVENVYLPGADGEMGILPMHAGLVTALQPDTRLQFTTLPLDAARSGEGPAAASPLRERVRDLPKPFWIAPKPPAKPA